MKNNTGSLYPGNVFMHCSHLTNLTELCRAKGRTFIGWLSNLLNIAFLSPYVIVMQVLHRIIHLFHYDYVDCTALGHCTALSVISGLQADLQIK